VKPRRIAAAALVAAVACRSAVEETAMAGHGKDRAAITAEVQSRHGVANQAGVPERWLGKATWRVFQLGDRQLLLAQVTETTWGNAPRAAFYGWLGDGAEPSLWHDAFAFETATDGASNSTRPSRPGGSWSP